MLGTLYGSMQTVLRKSRICCPYYTNPQTTRGTTYRTDNILSRCDMVTTVNFERLNKPYVKSRHGRVFKELMLPPTENCR